MVVVRTVFTLADTHNWILHKIDGVTSFLQGFYFSGYTLKYFMSIEIAPNEYGVILNRWI